VGFKGEITASYTAYDFKVSISMLELCNASTTYGPEKMQRSGVLVSESNPCDTALGEKIAPLSRIDIEHNAVSCLQVEV